MDKKPKKLNIDDDLKTHYAIPIWLRNEQIKVAIQKVKGCIEPYPEGQTRTDPVAIAGFGPSLQDTWEAIRGFKYIISCSGSHPFLIERGIVPTWHTAVDPLPGNTVKLIGQPHKDVQYVISSTCNPDVWDHLEGYQVKRWNVFDGEPESIRALLPPGEWAITGGCDVGLRSLTIARFFGFTDLHVFGIDGSSPTQTGGRHAGAHPNPLKSKQELDYEGRTFYTTSGMLAAAKGIWHELDQMPDVKIKFYGEGLVQYMAKFYKPKPLKGSALIGFNKPETISAAYIEQNRQLHATNLAYGVGGGRHAETIKKIMATLTNPSVLDYGCGKGLLAKELSVPIWEYDPAIEGKEESPRPADVVVCTDVLEHIEPDKLLDVLHDLKRCVKNVGFFTIHTKAAIKKLPDGRNTHLIQKHKQWWKNRLAAYFDIGSLQEVGPELWVVVGVKQKEKKKAA